MFRYRCPQCSQILQAPEIRAGKASVCPKCSKPIHIPADKSQWLNERGEPHAPAAEPMGEANAASPAPAAAAMGATSAGPVSRMGDEKLPPAETAIDSPYDAHAPIRVTAEAPRPESPRADRPEPVEPPARILPKPTSPESVAPTPTPSPVAVAPSKPDAVVPVAPTRAMPPTETMILAKAEPAAVLAPMPAAISAIVEVASEAVLPTRVPPAETPAPIVQATPALPVDPVASAARVEAQRISVSLPHAPAGPARAAGANGNRAEPRRVQVIPTGAGRPVGADADESVSFNHPLHLRTELDIAAALTHVLTTRMKPPPKPPRDLRPSSAFWLLLTGVALALLGLSLFTAANHLKWVAYLGVAELAIGYVWIVMLVFRRDPSSALICAVPPATVWYLTRRRYKKYRPLSFAMTGALLIAIAGASRLLAPHTREFAGAYDRPAGPVATDFSKETEVVQLREYRKNREDYKLLELLRALDRTDPQYSSAASRRVELAAELRTLCDPASSPRSDVRAAALPAYVRWAENDGARAVLMAAVQSGDLDERKQAIKLLPRWRDPEAARAIASRLGHSEEKTAAKEALLQMGGPVAEGAVIPLLLDEAGDKVVRLAALDLMCDKRIGGEAAVKALADVIDHTKDESLRRQSESKINDVRAQVRERGKGSG